MAICLAWYFDRLVVGLAELSTASAYTAEPTPGTGLVGTGHLRMSTGWVSRASPAKIDSD